MGLIQDPNRDYKPPLTRPEKDAARAKIAADLEEFLQRGGRIDTLEHGATGNPLTERPLTWDATTNSIAGGATRLAPRMYGHGDKQ